jgi:hypothetical protein
MSDRTTSRKFMTWNAAQLALRKHKVSSHGATATLLLEAFLEDNGRITASKVVARGVCKEGEFSLWRRQLIDKGWLVWTDSQNDKGQYFPGKKLLPYLNKEKSGQEEMASMRDLRRFEQNMDEKKADRSELDELRRRMAKFEELASRLEAATRDPITDEKLAVQKKCAAEMKLLSRAN